MPSDYRAIGNEILEKLEFDPTRLGEALSTLNEVIRDCLESGSWNEVPTHCESAYELCDVMQSSEELRGWSNVIDPAHAEGIFHAYEGISHLYQAEEAKENENRYEESKELAKAIYCLERSQQSFRFEYRDQWNEVIIWLSLGRLYRSQSRLDDALLAFERSCTFSNFDRLSIERMQEIVKVVSTEIEKTRRIFGDQKPFAPGELGEPPPPTQHKGIPFGIPIIGEIAAGKEKPVSDDIIGYIQQTDESEFEFEGQALEVKSLRGSQFVFLPEYGYVVAVQISGDSMDQAGIFPDDYVILQKPRDVPLKPSSGDIVAVVFRDEDVKATLKRFYFDKSSGSVTLKPESSNPEYKTRVLRPEAFAGDNPSVEVVGIAIAVLKLQRQKVIIFRLPIVDEIAAGKEKPVSDDDIEYINIRTLPVIADEIPTGEEKSVLDYDIIGHIQQTDELEFEFEERTLKVELLKGNRLTFLPGYDYVAVQISGDSMDQANIAPNDYVILRRKSKYVPLSPTSGDIVAVVFRDEDDKATLKRIYIEPNRVILKPESSNPEHQPRILRPEAFAGDNPRVAVVGIAMAVLKLRSVPSWIPIGEESTTYELAEKFFEEADFDIEPGIHHSFCVKNDSPEWRGAGKMPVYCFEEGQPVTGHKVAQLVSEVPKEDRHGTYAFIILHERLVDGAAWQLWELKQSDNLTVIPIHAVEIRQILREPHSTPSGPAYWKLVALKRQWSMIDPYASVNSLTDPQWFFGRQRRAIIQETLSDITDGVDYLVVYGMRGAGKTTLLNQLALACQEQKYPVAKILCKPLSDQYTYAHVLSEIIQQWGTALEALYSDVAILLPSAMFPKTASKLFKEKVSKLSKLAKDIRQQRNHAVKFVLILDRVEHVFPSQDSAEDAYSQYCNLTRILKSVLEAPECGIFSVVAAMEYPWIHLIDRFPHNEQFQNPLYGHFRLKPIGFLQREDWDDMVQTIGELAGLEYTTESLDVLYRKSSGHPEITRKLCSCLVELGKIRGPITAQDAYSALGDFLKHAYSSYYLETTFWKDPLSTDLDAEQRLMQELAKKEKVSEDDLLFELLGRYEEFIKIRAGSPASGEKVSVEKRRLTALLSKLLGRYTGSLASKVNAEKRRLTDALRHLVDLQIVAEDKQQGAYAISIPIYRDWIRQEILAMEVEYA